MKELIFLEIILLYMLKPALTVWQDGTPIKSHLNKDELDRYYTFSNHDRDELSLLKSSSDSLIVGAKNALFSLSYDDLSVKHVLNWTVAEKHREMCQMKGQPDWKCQNFIRLFHGPIKPMIDSKAQYIVCGTNAFKPKCRYYSEDSLENVTKEFSGIGYVPFDPTSQATSLLHDGNSVYAATIADFGGTDPLIYKQPLRTDQHYVKQLNSPMFLNSESYKDYALFFFREFALEHENCGKAIYSRVGRICGHDVGIKSRFSTFLKARLNCSVPGEFPFYFDYLENMSPVFYHPETGEDMVYGVFKTAPNSLGGSAVCAFKMRDLIEVFEGDFKGQATRDSNWLPVPSKKVPKPRPGLCSATNAKMTFTSYAFIREHALMDEAVKGELLLTSISNTFHFTAIAVDNSKSVHSQQILYIGTSNGTVLKSILPSKGSQKWNDAVISQSWKLFDDGVPIRSLRLSPDFEKLFVLTSNGSVLMSVKNCEKYTTCHTCSSIQDPHCFWDFSSSKCTEDSEGNENLKEKFLHQKCPVEKSDETKISKGVGALDCSLCESNEIMSKVGMTSSTQSNEPVILNPTISSSTVQSNAIRNIITFNEEDRRAIDEIVIEAKINDAESYEASDEILPPDIEEPVLTFVADEQAGGSPVVAATMTSAVLCLLIGFGAGFVTSRWMVLKFCGGSPCPNRHLNGNESQRLTKSIDKSPSNGILKNNLVTSDSIDTGKSVKKCYI